MCKYIYDTSIDKLLAYIFKYVYICYIYIYIYIYISKNTKSPWHNQNIAEQLIKERKFIISNIKTSDTGRINVLN